MVEFPAFLAGCENTSPTVWPEIVVITNERSFVFHDRTNSAVDAFRRHRFGQVFRHPGVPRRQHLTPFRIARANDDRDVRVWAVRVSADTFDKGNSVQFRRPVADDDVGVGGSEQFIGLARLSVLRPFLTPNSLNTPFIRRRIRVLFSKIRTLIFDKL